MLDFATITPEIVNDRLHFPPVEGYTLSIFGSDTQPVIGLDGRVHPPLVDCKVRLILQAVADTGGVVQATENTIVTVPGRFTKNTKNTENSWENRNQAPAVVPSLREWHGGTGAFVSASRIVYNAPALARTADITAADYTDITGRPAEVTMGDTPAPGDIFLQLSDAPSLGALGREGYEMTVAGHVTVAAPHVTGVFFGTRTVLQILKADRNPTAPHRHIPKGIARDYPKYEIRGFMLDTARMFFPLWFLESYVKLMAWYKMNTLHIGLNNDGFPEYFSPDGDWEHVFEAFRLESKVYPGLASESGHYTQEAFRGLQQLAFDYGMEILPEINSPAHALSFARRIPGMPVYPFFGTHVNPTHQHTQNQIDITRPEAFALMRPLIEEFIAGESPVFLGKRLHIGTDEFRAGRTTPDADPNDGHFQVNGDTINNHFRRYQSQMFDLLRQHGFRPHSWGALSEKPGDVPVDPTGVTLSNWCGTYQHPQEAVAWGYDLINIMYYNYIVSKAGFWERVDFQRIFKSEPINIEGPKSVPINFLDGHPNIKGGMFAIWNDIVHNGISTADVHVEALAPIQLYSQVNWSGQTAHTGISWDTFVARANAAGEAPRANVSRTLAHVPGNEVLNLQTGGGLARILRRHNIEETVCEGGAPTFYFKGGDSFLETDIAGLGFMEDLNRTRTGWTMTMDINPDADNPANATLLASDRSALLLTQSVTLLPQDTNSLGFNTALHGAFAVHPNNHHYFAYKVPPGEWTTLTLTGDSEGTRLYVNGVLHETLQKTGIPRLYNKGKKLRYMETLQLPLQFIGGPRNAFKGYMRRLRVYNRVFSDAEVAGM